MEPEPTGFCLACGAYLLPGLRWCDELCLDKWDRQGAAYAVRTGDSVRVVETDNNGHETRSYIATV